MFQSTSVNLQFEVLCRASCFGPQPYWNVDCTVLIKCTLCAVAWCTLLSHIFRLARKGERPARGLVASASASVLIGPGVDPASKFRGGDFSNIW